MKLLGWVHRKFRQNSCEPFKDFGLGYSCNCLSGQPSFNEGYGSRHVRQSQKERTIGKSYLGVEVEDNNFEDESSEAISELFHGLLTIGTLGSDPVTSDPATPTFAISVENITEKETEATENDLKLINDELEKVLGSQAKDDGYSTSSARSSHVSTITLSGKQMEGTESNVNESAVCPLQGYLFGSPIELPQTTVAKKEHRTSLGELFQRSKMVDENPTGKHEREEKPMEKEVEKSGIHLMKMFKRRMLNASSKSSTASTPDSVSAEKKLCKILHMFHRKVHPETPTVTKKLSKSHKYENKNKISRDQAYNTGDQPFPDEDVMIFSQRAISKVRRYKNHLNTTQIELDGNDSNGNRECWIKTDADYLVLEL
ncbi:protein LAZY 1 isoform X1 [Telopea speciosissima]|uniref:protein LAZY 1 isoform X1 n=1 Tax=Telopea speciosissima TaxID=54955 RepID=UPI001CC353F0|nr:protein LAZY 1 isoform X1 [Telopea speciosissima]